MDTSCEDSIEIKLNISSKIDDKTYFVLPKTVDQENEKLVKMLTPNDEEEDICKIKLSNDDVQSEMYSKIESEKETTMTEPHSITNTLLLNESIGEMKNEKIINDNSTCVIESNISRLHNDSLLQASSHQQKSTSQNESQNQEDELSQTNNRSHLNNTSTNSKKTKINDDETNQSPPKKLKSNNGDAIHTITSQVTTINQNSSPIQEINLIKLNQLNNKLETIKTAKLSSKNDQSRNDANATSQNDNDLIENDSSKIDANKSRPKNSQLDKNRKLTPNKKIKSAIDKTNNSVKNPVNIRMNSIRPSSSTCSNTKKINNTPIQSTNNNNSIRPSPANGKRINNPPFHNSTWDRLDHWQQDDTLKYLDFDEPKNDSNNKTRFGKDGKSLKKSPKMIIDLKTKSNKTDDSSMRKSNSRSSNTTSKTRSSEANNKSSSDIKSKTISKQPAVLPIFSKSIDSNQTSTSSSNNKVQMGDKYSKKIRKAIDEELSFLGHDVRDKVVNQMFSILKEAVFEGIKIANNTGSAQVKELFTIKPLAVPVDNSRDEKENSK